MQISICICMRIKIFLSMHVRIGWGGTHTRLCVCVGMPIYIVIFAHPYIYVHIYTYMHVHEAQTKGCLQHGCSGVACTSLGTGAYLYVHMYIYVYISTRVYTCEWGIGTVCHRLPRTFFRREWGEVHGLGRVAARCEGLEARRRLRGAQAKVGFFASSKPFCHFMAFMLGLAMTFMALAGRSVGLQPRCTQSSLQKNSGIVLGHPSRQVAVHKLTLILVVESDWLRLLFQE